MRILIGWCFLLLGASAQASVLYTYTGSNYTDTWNSTYSDIQNTSPAPVPLDASMSVSIDLVFDQALVTNGQYVLYQFSDTSIYDNYSGNYATELLSFSFSDGINTLSSDNNFSEITFLEIWFFEGEIGGWALEASSVNGGTYFQSRISTHSGIAPSPYIGRSYSGDTSAGVYDDIAYSQRCSSDPDCEPNNGPPPYYSDYYFGGAAKSSSVGSWSSSVVPVPAAIWLFCSALAGLGWMRRKQKV